MELPLEPLLTPPLKPLFPPFAEFRKEPAVPRLPMPAEPRENPPLTVPGDIPPAREAGTPTEAGLGSLCIPAFPVILPPFPEEGREPRPRWTDGTPSPWLPDRGRVIPVVPPRERGDRTAPSSRALEPDGRTTSRFTPGILAPRPLAAAGGLPARPSHANGCPPSRRTFTEPRSTGRSQRARRLSPRAKERESDLLSPGLKGTQRTNRSFPMKRTFAGKKRAWWPWNME